MNMRSSKIARLLSVTAFTALVAMAGAGVAEAERLADKLMEYRLPDGGILVNKTSNPKGRLVPYFSNLAALGWVETAKVTTNTQKRTSYLEATRTWLDWYQKHQNPNGTIYDYEGAPGDLKATGGYDSTDSYAATYALLLWRYFEATRDVEFLRGKASSIDGAHDAVLLTMDAHGLTYAHPHYAYRFLMDNCEVAAGFAAFDKLYTTLQQPDKAAASRAHLAKLKDQFNKYYLQKFDAFAYAIDPFGVPVGDFSRGYPDAMANLFAITFLAPDGAESTALLERIKDKFWTQPDSQNFPQWWIWPAMITGDKGLEKGAMTKLQTQAEEDTAHSYLVGMAAATHVSGVNSLRFPEVICTWPQLTAPVSHASLKPQPDGNLFLPKSSVIITGHKASGSLNGGAWQTTDAPLPATVTYKITTATGYLQLNLVWPGNLDLSESKTIKLDYTIPDGNPATQVQVTLVESDGDWWDAPVGTSQSGKNEVEFSLDKLTLNPWGKKGDNQPGLASLRGIRIQVSNKTGAPAEGSISVSRLENR